MKNLLLFTPLLFLFSSCGKDARLAQRAFTEIITEQEWTEEKAEQYFTKLSLTYLQKLAETSNATDYSMAEKLGFEYGPQLVTMKMHGELNIYKNIIKPEENSLSLQDVLHLMQLNGTGILGMSLQNRLKFREVADVSGSKAQVKVSVATGGKAKIISNYIFEKEDEKWKINLLSTLTMEEKVLKQNLRRSPLRNDKAAFIVNHLSSPPQEMQFQYRTK